MQRTTTAIRAIVLVFVCGAAPFARAADCNENGIDDLDDIAAGTSRDCNLNLVPDECDVLRDLVLDTPAIFGLPTTGIAARTVFSDLDGDGALDAVMATHRVDQEVPAALGNIVRVVRGGGDGTFRAPVEYTLGLGPSQIEVADVDSDGLDDVVTLHGRASPEGGYGVSVLRNEGGAVLSTPSVYPTSTRPRELLVAELDGANGPDVGSFVDSTSAVPPGEDILVVWIHATVPPEAPAGGEIRLVPTNGPGGSGVGPFRLRNEMTFASEARFVSTLPQTGIGRLKIVGDQSFFRGDSNGDEAIDLSDAVHTLDVLFLGGGALDCEDAADANDDGTLDITDPVYTLGFLFLGGEQLPPPRGARGLDPTPDGLRCLR